MTFQAACAHIVMGQRVLWLCLQVGGREGHSCLPSISAEDRGKERVGVTGRAPCVTMERGEEGFSPEYQENLKRRCKLLNKSSLQGLKQIPTLEGLPCQPQATAAYRVCVRVLEEGPSCTWPGLRRSRISQVK